MVMVWWKGTQCEGQGEDKSGCQYDRRKRRNDKKNDLSGKKKSSKKKNKLLTMAPAEVGGQSFDHRPQVRPDWVFTQ